jgi:hypothetical protein
MRYEEVNPGEWQVDPKTGERFRMVGHIKEYEMMIHTSGGIVPASELAEHNKRQKEAEERRKAAADEAWKNRPEPKSCPFANGCNTLCKREGCKIFANGKCALATIADASGVEIEEAPAKDNRKCPFSIYGHCEGCALYNKGCAVVRLAASTINK